MSVLLHLVVLKNNVVNNHIAVVEHLEHITLNALLDAVNERVTVIVDTGLLQKLLASKLLVVDHKLAVSETGVLDVDCRDSLREIAEHLRSHVDITAGKVSVDGAGDDAMSDRRSTEHQRTLDVIGDGMQAITLAVVMFLVAKHTEVSSRKGLLELKKLLPSKILLLLVLLTLGLTLLACDIVLLGVTVLLLVPCHLAVTTRLGIAVLCLVTTNTTVTTSLSILLGNRLLRSLLGDGNSNLATVTRHDVVC